MAFLSHPLLFLWVLALWHIHSCRDTLRQRQPGQGLVEYGLILVLIMVVCVGILSVVGRKVSGTWYDKIIAAFPA